MGATCCNRAVPRYRERSWESTSLAAMGHECLSDTFFGGLSGFVSCFLYKPEDFHVLGLFFIQDGSQYGKMARRMGRWREAFRRRTGTEECRHHQVAGMQFTVGYGWGMDVLHRGMTWYATWNIYIYTHKYEHMIWRSMKIHDPKFIKFDVLSFCHVGFSNGLARCRATSDRLLARRALEALAVSLDVMTRHVTEVMTFMKFMKRERHWWWLRGTMWHYVAMVLMIGMTWYDDMIVMIGCDWYHWNSHEYGCRSVENDSSV